MWYSSRERVFIVHIILKDPVFSAEAHGAIPLASQCKYISDGLFPDFKTV